MTNRLCSTYEVMMKCHEFNATKAPEDIKPRNLFNPHFTIKAVLGLVNHNLIQLFKKAYSPSFIQGMSTETIQDIIQNNYEEGMEFMMWDGSSFDAH